MEITQFTYFQQAGGIDLKPVSRRNHLRHRTHRHVPAGVDNVYDLEWIKGIRYGDVHHQTEVEFSTYNFEEADTDMLFAFSTCTKRNASAWRKESWCFPPTILC
jgi:glycyl-tRNA synthetase alpha chain